MNCDELIVEFRKKKLQDLWGAGELFHGVLDEMKQGLDVSHLGDEAYQNKCITAFKIKVILHLKSKCA